MIKYKTIKDYENRYYILNNYEAKSGDKIQECIKVLIARQVFTRDDMISVYEKSSNYARLIDSPLDCTLVQYVIDRMKKSYH